MSTNRMNASISPSLQVHEPGQLLQSEHRRHLAARLDTLLDFVVNNRSSTYSRYPCSYDVACGQIPAYVFQGSSKQTALKRKIARYRTSKQLAHANNFGILCGSTAGLQPPGLILTVLGNRTVFRGLLGYAYETHPLLDARVAVGSEKSTHDVQADKGRMYVLSLSRGSS